MRSDTQSIKGTGTLEAVEHKHSLLSLLELSNELNSSRDLYEIVDIALLNLMGHFGSSRTALWFFPEESARGIVPVRSYGLPEPVGQEIGEIWLGWLLGREEGTSEPVLVADVAARAPAAGMRLARDYGIALFAPVQAKGKFLGLVGMGRRVGGGDYHPLDLEILLASLNILGVALENAHLYNRIMENNRRFKRANEELTELDRLKSEFLRGLNHEFRTPLNIITGYLQVLRTAVKDRTLVSERVEEDLEVIHEQTSRLQDMLLKLLDFSELQRDALLVRPREANLAAAMRHFYEERRPGISACLRKINYSVDGEVPVAVFDPYRVVQIVDALIDNAVKFTQQGSEIHLRVSEESGAGGKWVRVDVEDDGPGIPPDRLPFIFESFRPGDGSVSREHGGLGMGLAFARQLAEKMGGRLNVRSEMGKGSTLTLLLPAASPFA